jgi:hypothetical protein
MLYPDMEKCDVCRLLEAQYRRSRENTLEARRQFDRATTSAHAECAAAWLRRAEEQWLVAISELLTSPRSCSCERLELADVFADYRLVEGAGADPRPICIYVQ